MFPALAGFANLPDISILSSYFFILIGTLPLGASLISVLNLIISSRFSKLLNQRDISFPIT